MKIFILVFLLLAWLIFWPFKFTLWMGQNLSSLYGNFSVRFFGIDVKKSRYRIQLHGINFIKKKREVFVSYENLSQGSEFFERFSMHVYRGIDFKELYYHYNLSTDDLLAKTMAVGSFQAVSGAFGGILWQKHRCPTYSYMTADPGEDSSLWLRCIIRLSLADIILAFAKAIIGGRQHGKQQPD